MKVSLHAQAILIYNRAMNYKQIIKHFKSQSKAAAFLELSRQAVGQWKNKPIKADRQKYIELMTGGALKADKVKRHAKIEGAPLE